MLRTIVPSI